MRLRFLLSVFLLLLYFGCITAQTIYSCSARAIALSGSDIYSSNNWSGIDNPAGLAKYTHYSISGSYCNRYTITELGSQLLCGTIPTSGGTFSPILNYFGSRSFNQVNIALGYGLSLTTWLNAGIRLGYYRIAAEATMNHSSAVTGDISILARPMTNLAVAAVLMNPTRTKLNDFSGDRLPGSLHMAITYAEIDNFSLSSKLTWDNFERLNCSMGAEYILIRQLWLQAGAEFPVTVSYSFGLEMRFESIILNLGIKMHPQLGPSTALSFSYKFR